MELDKYFHCKNCLQTEPTKSSIFDAGMKDDKLMIVCKNCGQMVFSTTLAPDLLGQIVKQKCPFCVEEEEENDGKTDSA